MSEINVDSLLFKGSDVPVKIGRTFTGAWKQGAQIKTAKTILHYIRHIAASC